MRIGIDAKQYFTGPVSSRVILQNLLPQLFDLYTEHDWFVFFDKKDEHRVNPFSHQKISIRYVHTPTNMLSNLLLLPRQIRKDNLDVTLFMMFAPFIKKSKSVVFIHDVLFMDHPEYFTWKEKSYFKPILWLTKKADRIICTTNYVSDKLLQYHFVKSKAKIDIASLGISNEFRPVEKHEEQLLNAIREKFNLPESYILFVGRLNARKNIEGLLKAVPLIMDKEIKIVIVGEENWKAPDLKGLLSDPVLAKRILFTGKITDHELEAVYAMATIFCFPSFAEGFGLPPLEAMASGIPVIVSKTSAIPEVCGDAAVYIDPDQPEEIASAISMLLTDKTFYDEKKQAGLKRAANFTWEKTAHQVMKSLVAAW